MLQDPSGVLLITPESLEALFIMRGPKIPQLFGELHYVLVDELHAFIGTERGRQLQSLLNRVEIATRRIVPRIALSATLGDMHGAADFLRPGRKEEALLIIDDTDGQELKLQVRGYWDATPRTDGTDQEENLLESCDSAVAIKDQGVHSIARDLFRTLRGSDNLIFANSRGRVEHLSALLREMADRQRVPNEFYPHHGSLSKNIREEAEDRVRDKSRPGNAICTTTLELGIDIGNVASIAQVGCPPSVSSLRQRLGRSGRRRGTPAILRMYILEEELTERSSIVDELRMRLVQCIAMVELLLTRWYEPPESNQLHLSTLIQQILSLVAQYGGIKANECWRVLSKHGPFDDLDEEQFIEVLRSLGKHDLITQTHDGVLVQGLSGERLVEHYSFYAAFNTSEEYRLVSGSRTLGSLPILFPLIAGMYMVFAGRRWQVIDVDTRLKTVFLEPSKGGRIPKFIGSGPLVHDRVREKMSEIYRSDMTFAYLDEEAGRLLSQGRSVFNRLGLARTHIVKDGKDAILFPWAGDRVLHTMFLQFLSLGLKPVSEGSGIRVQGCSTDTLSRALRNIADGDWTDALSLAQKVKNKVQNKHDGYLSDRLLCADYASRNLNLLGARKVAQEIFGKSPS